MNQNKTTMRAGRIRRKIRAVSNRPRLSIHKSNRFISLQLIDDQTSKTIVGIHEKTVTGATPSERRQALAKAMAEKIKAVKIKQVVFDRGANRYHGAVAEIAEALRANGIEF
jgi:large subunit ribosomal protein L18